MKSSEIRVKKTDIIKFLKDVQDPSSKLSPIPTKEKSDVNTPTKAKLVDNTHTNKSVDTSVQTLFDKLRESQDISWDMKIEFGYDPNTTIKRDLLERVKSIVVLIESGDMEEHELKSKKTELEILKQQLKLLFNTDGPQPIDDSKHSYMKPGHNNSLLDKHDFKPLASNDYKIRPGYEMTDKMIKNRGSSASFDTSLLGELDYKKTVQFLCSQIKSSGLGEPKEFGCIENPEAEVGPNYSWKGNYKMVCSRLGRSWGEFYPEMFGCPKPDQAHNQHPKINKNCTTSANKQPPIDHPNVPCKA